MHIQVLEAFVSLYPYQRNFPRSEKGSQMTIWKMTAMIVHHFTLCNQNLLSYFPNTGHLDTLACPFDKFLCSNLCIVQGKKKSPQIPQRMTRSERIVLLSLLIQSDFQKGCTNLYFQQQSMTLTELFKENMHGMLQSCKFTIYRQEIKQSFSTSFLVFQYTRNWVPHYPPLTIPQKSTYPK